MYISYVHTWTAVFLRHLANTSFMPPGIDLTLFWPLLMSMHPVATPNPVSSCLLQWLKFHPNIFCYLGGFSPMYKQTSQQRHMIQGTHIYITLALLFIFFFLHSFHFPGQAGCPHSLRPLHLGIQFSLCQVVFHPPYSIGIVGYFFLKVILHFMHFSASVFLLAGDLQSTVPYSGLFLFMHCTFGSRLFPLSSGLAFTVLKSVIPIVRWPCIHWASDILDYFLRHSLVQAYRWIFLLPDGLAFHFTTGLIGHSSCPVLHSL